MSLFAKKKEESESKDTQDIKSASNYQTPPPFNGTTANQENTQPNPNNSNNQDFVNPFASSSSTPQQSEVQNNNFQTNQFQNPQTQTNQQTGNSESNQVDEERLQELIDESVEKIIQERWEKVTANVERVVSWKSKVEQEVHLLKEDILTIKSSFETFEKRLMNKISSYDKNILDVNSEIKALDKVFQKITPTLVNNVNELSRIAEELREGNPKLQQSKKNSDE